MSKATIQVEKLTVEEIDYKIDKKEVYYKCEPATIYFKEVLDMTGTETFTVLSTEDLEQTSGGLAVWEDGYGRCLYHREFAPYMGKGHLILIEMLGSTASEQDNLSKKVR